MRVAALVLTAAVMHLCGTPSHAGVGDDIICGGGAATAGGSQQQATSRLAQLAAHLTTPAPEPTARRAAEVAAAAPERPHILLVVADDLGWNDVGSWNGPGLPTAYAPVLDELMATGVKLKQHYSEAICSPTRGALMSGRYPHRWGGQSAVAIQNTENYFPLDEVTLATRLKEVGYSTHLTGKWHLGFNAPEHLPTARGFDSSYGPWLGDWDQYRHTIIGPHPYSGRHPRGGVGLQKDENPDGIPNEETFTLDFQFQEAGAAFSHVHGLEADGLYSSEAFAQRAVTVVNAHASEENGQPQQPLFLFMPFTAPHTPTQAPSRYNASNAGRVNPYRVRHANMVTALDEAVGDVVAALKAAKMYEHTLVAWFSDNGGIPYELQAGFGPYGGDALTGQDEKPLGYPACSSNWPLRGNKGSAWEGGVRTTAFVSGGWLPESVRGTESQQLWHMTDWFATLLGPGVANGNVAAAAGKTLDSVDQWPKLVSGSSGVANPRTEVVLRNDAGLWGFPWSADGTLPAVQAYRMDTPDGKRWKLLRGQFQPGMWWSADPDPGEIIAAEGGALSTPAPLYSKPPNGFADARHIKGTPQPFATTWGRPPLRDQREGLIAEGAANVPWPGHRDGEKDEVWLFELRSDPEERHNLATERPDLVETMGRRVDELTMESTRSSGDVTVERSKLNGRRFIAAIEARKLLPGLHGVDTFDYAAN